MSEAVVGLSEQELARIEGYIREYRGDADSGPHSRWEAVQITLAGITCQQLLDEVRRLRAALGALVKASEDARDVGLGGDWAWQSDELRDAIHAAEQCLEPASAHDTLVP